VARGEMEGKLIEFDETFDGIQGKFDEIERKMLEMKGSS
jgi:hypothetical protein